MVERPIIFSGPMVRAILEGRKTQTRRVVKGNPIDIVTLIGADDKPTGEYGLCFHPSVIERRVSCPYGQPGDRLWVRETRGINRHGDVVYRADTSDFSHDVRDENQKWKPSIHMPRRASRITLEVLRVRVERLQEISEEDAKAEGAEMQPAETGQLDANGNPIEKGSYRLGFYSLWESINGPGSWIENPWVWAVKFPRISP